MMDEGVLRQKFMQKSHDGEFAVAYAILVLADKMDGIARALRLLGTADAATPMGALEVVSASLERIADAISDVGTRD